MAKSLEEHLYRSAVTKEEYMDFSTLRRRLQTIAHGLDLHRGSGRSNDDASVSSSSGRGSFVVTGQQQQVGQSSVSSSQQQQLGGGLFNQQALTASGPFGGNNNSQNSQDGFAATDISALIGSQALGSAPISQQQPNLVAQPPSSLLQRNSSLSSQMTQQTGSTSVTQQGMISRHSSTSQQPRGKSQWSSSSLPAVGLGSSSQGNSSAEAMQKRKVISQQQQRLLLLRHASKCSAGPSCTTKFCSQMVTLWKHMKACRNKHCKTPHCVSSRCVLNHYRICKSKGQTSTCEVCGPVMLQIKQKEASEGSASTVDPLAKDQELNSSSDAISHNRQLEQLQLQQQHQILQQQQQQQAHGGDQNKLAIQLETLRQLQEKQADLQLQQRRLEVHAQQIQDPTAARNVEEQKRLLGNLQLRCQERQQVLQREMQAQLNSSAGLSQQQQLLQLQQQMQQGGSLGLVTSSAPAPVTQLSHVLDKPRLQSTDVIQPVPAQVRATGKGIGKTLGLGTALADSLRRESNACGANNSGMSSSRLNKISGDISRLGDVCLIPYMKESEISQHMDSLNKRFRLTSRQVTHKCLPLVQSLIDDPFGWVFNDAVDPISLGLPDYFEVVKTPMHLELVKQKLENAIYNELEACARDVRLVFQNAILYNGESSEVGTFAQTMLDKFEGPYQAMVRGTLFPVGFVEVH